MEINFKDLKQAVNDLQDQVDSMNYDTEEIEAKYYNVESRLEEFEADNSEEIDLSKLKSKMQNIKEELDLYDADKELDNMYPNRHDEDFDEDDMSGESFFKE